MTIYLVPTAHVSYLSIVLGVYRDDNGYVYDDNTDDDNGLKDGVCLNASLNVC